MTSRIRSVEYFHATVKDRPGEAYQLLSQLARSGVNLLAFSAVPAGIEHTQLMLFPESVEALLRTAASTGLVLTGPQHALLIQGDDELGAPTSTSMRRPGSQMDKAASATFCSCAPRISDRLPPFWDSDGTHRSAKATKFLVANRNG